MCLGGIAKMEIFTEMDVRGKAVRRQHTIPYMLLVIIVIMFLLSPDICCGMSREEKQRLRLKTKEMFHHGYQNYMNHAYPADELMPLSCRGRVRGVAPSRGDVDDALGNFSLTLIDTLDTLVILGDIDEFEHAVRLVIKDVQFDTDVVVSVFETNIRVVGGLLGGHLMAEHVRTKLGGMLWYKDELLKMAVDIGERLLPAFNTSTGMPFPRVNLRYGVKHEMSRTGQEKDTCTACAGTMILEFSALSRLTGNTIFETVALKGMDYLWQSRHRESDLVGTVINIHNGDWVRRDSGIGAGIDSYYEYLLKAYIMLGDETFLERFNRHYKAVMKYISNGPLMVDVHMHKPHTQTRNFMDSLLAFWPGLQVLKGDIKSAIELHELLYQVIQRHNFLPEAFTTDFRVHWAQHPLRPEFVESTYFIYKATGDPYYLEVGKSVIENLDRHARVDCGFAALKDVTTGAHEDQMDSYVLAETFKYLYLLFSEKDELSLDVDDYVFTTEAHLLPLFLSNQTKNITELTPSYILDELAAEDADDDDEGDHSCPSTSALFKGNMDYAHRLRSPLKNFVENLCPRPKSGARTPRLRAAQFIAGNLEQISQLSRMGVRLITMSDGRVQLLHISSEAASPEDSEEGLLFMQDMIDMSKSQTHEAALQQEPQYIQFMSHPYLGMVSLRAGPAQFGTSLKGHAGFEGQVVMAVPFRGCQPIENENVAGKFVIVERGDCMFIDKARNIQKAGALGGIVFDNNSQSHSEVQTLFAMSGDGKMDITIPMVFLFYNEAIKLRNALAHHPDLLIYVGENSKKPQEVLLRNLEFGQTTSSESRQFPTTYGKSPPPPPVFLPVIPAPQATPPPLGAPPPATRIVSDSSSWEEQLSKMVLKDHSALMKPQVLRLLVNLLTRLRLSHLIPWIKSRSPPSTAHPSHSRSPNHDAYPPPRVRVIRGRAGKETPDNEQSFDGKDCVENDKKSDCGKSSDFEWKDANRDGENIDPDAGEGMARDKLEHTGAEEEARVDIVECMQGEQERNGEDGQFGHCGGAGSVGGEEGGIVGGADGGTAVDGVVEDGHPDYKRGGADAVEDGGQELVKIVFTELILLLQECTTLSRLDNVAQTMDALARLTEKVFTQGRMDFGVYTEATLDSLPSRLEILPACRSLTKGDADQSAETRIGGDAGQKTNGEVAHSLVIDNVHYVSTMNSAGDKMTINIDQSLSSINQPAANNNRESVFEGGVKLSVSSDGSAVTLSVASGNAKDSDTISQQLNDVLDTYVRLQLTQLLRDLPSRLHDAMAGSAGVPGISASPPEIFSTEAGEEAGPMEGQGPAHHAEEEAELRRRLNVPDNVHTAPDWMNLDVGQLSIQPNGEIYTNIGRREYSVDARGVGGVGLERGNGGEQGNGEVNAREDEDGMEGAEMRTLGNNDRVENVDVKDRAEEENSLDKELLTNYVQQPIETIVTGEPPFHVELSITHGSAAEEEGSKSKESLSTATEFAQQLSPPKSSTDTSLHVDPSPSERPSQSSILRDTRLSDTLRLRSDVATSIHILPVAANERRPEPSDSAPLRDTSLLQDRTTLSGPGHELPSPGQHDVIESRSKDEGGDEAPKFTDEL